MVVHPAKMTGTIGEGECPLRIILIVITRIGTGEWAASNTTTGVVCITDRIVTGVELTGVLTAVWVVTVRITVTGIPTIGRTLVAAVGAAAIMIPTGAAIATALPFPGGMRTAPAITTGTTRTETGLIGITAIHIVGMMIRIGDSLTEPVMKYVPGLAMMRQNAAEEWMSSRIGTEVTRVTAIGKKDLFKRINIKVKSLTLYRLFTFIFIYGQQAIGKFKLYSKTLAL